MAASPDRAEIRRAGRAARQLVQGSDRLNAERRLVGHLQSLAALQASSVGVFVAHDAEPDLAPLISWLWARGTTVALPVLSDDPADHTMWFAPWARGTQLQPGRYDIPVPVGAEPITPHTLVVSLTGFDPSGNRMGRGGGFFDRYLADYEGEVVGVGFEVQRFERVPTDDHDIGLPVMVTDLGVRYFS